VIFGSAYAVGAATAVILTLATTFRAAYLPAVRQIQADAGLKAVHRWFVAGLVVHTAAAIAVAKTWGLPGIALTVLGEAVLFETVPVVVAVRRVASKRQASTTRRQFVILSLAALGVLAVVPRSTFSWDGARYIAGVGAAVCLALGGVALIRYVLSLRSV